MKYWKKDHKEEDAVYYLSRHTRNWALIVGLEPDTYYWVKVMVYNAAGEGPESERFLERTYRKAPQKPPSSVHIYGINPSSIRVVWRYVSPSQEEEPVEGYKIRIWEADQDMATANDTLVQLGRKLEYVVENLTPGRCRKRSHKLLFITKHFFFSVFFCRENVQAARAGLQQRWRWKNVVTDSHFPNG